MARYFVVTREGMDGERLYEASGDSVTMLDNRAIKFGVGESGEPKDAIKAQEQKTWPTDKRAISIEEVNIRIGQFYPSVARPTFRANTSLIVPNSDHELELAKSIWRELEVIKQDLENCFNVNTVTDRNFSAFGTRYEQIIYFCCIGVESLFRKIFTDSGIPKKNFP